MRGFTTLYGAIGGSGRQDFELANKGELISDLREIGDILRVSRVKMRLRGDRNFELANKGEMISNLREICDML